MKISDLTLDEIYDLETRHSALVGCRTSVFIAPEERAGRLSPKEALYAHVKVMAEELEAMSVELHKQGLAK